MIRLRTPFLAAALFTGVAAVGLAPALAQAAPGPANSTAAPNEARHHAMARMMPGQFVDGRIAFLKAELKITRLRPFLQHHARTTDSPLEGVGFEPSIPRRERFSRLPRLSSPSRCRERDRGFESLFLHRRVWLREF